MHQATPASECLKAAASRGYRESAFSFTGSAGEYFRIWVLNTLLSVVTLGAFSAWAKVRRKQYFYRNTWVDGSNFDYVASPIAILKGRALAAALLIALFAAERYANAPSIATIALGFVLLPWVLVNSSAFNARNSLYRNIRFSFAGDVRAAFLVYAKALAAYLLSFGLAYPFVVFSATRFAVTKHRFGELEFQWGTTPGRYFSAYILALSLACPVYALLLAFAAWVRARGMPSEAPTVLLSGLVIFYLYLLVPAAFLRARLTNLRYGGMRVGDHLLMADLRGGELLKLYLTNTIAIVVSLGLMIPWARVRVAAYEASRLTLHVAGALELSAKPGGAEKAVGEGLSDLGDFELGVGT
jgi:uncharacterized membrane protein YjgN (DUF898 family)